MEPQPPIAQPQLQPQYRAGQRQFAAAPLPGRQPFVLPCDQLQPLQRRGQIVVRRVVPPVLLHTQPPVQLALDRPIFPPRAPRGDLQHEVRPLRLLPQPVRLPVAAVRSHHHEDVRGHHRLRVALLVVDEQVPRHVYVRPVAEVEPQPVHGVGQRRALMIGFRHRLPVGRRIVDRRGRGRERRVRHGSSSAPRQFWRRRAARSIAGPGAPIRIALCRLQD